MTMGVRRRIPLGATGKMLKTRLREQLKDYLPPRP
jgi:hypothetical protein